MKECTKYLNISTDLIKTLMKEEKIDLLDIIFSNLKYINKEYEYCEISLFDACESGNDAVVKCLVEHGANINKKK